MATPIVVEVLDNRGRVHGRTRLDRFPATIGRGYGNDVIIDDPFSDPEHLRVIEDADGSLVAEDAGSVNGTFEGPTRTRAARIAIRPGLELRVGRTTLRFQDPAQPVRPAIADRGSDAPAWLESRQVAAIVVLVTGIVYAMQNWLSSYERTTAAKQINTAVGIFIVIGIWAGCWSLANRANRHRFNFRGHFLLACVVSVLFVFADGAGKWLSAIAPSADLNVAVAILVETPLVLLLISGHLALASGLARVARLRTAAFIIVGVLAMTGLKAWADRDDFTTDMNYDSTIRPVPTALLHTVPVAKFFKDSESLRDEVDSLAAKANRESGSR